MLFFYKNRKAKSKVSAFQVGEVCQAAVPHRRPQDGAGRGHPDGLLLGADRAVRREAVAGDGLQAGALEVGVHHHHRAGTSRAKVPVITFRPAGKIWETSQRTHKEASKLQRSIYDTNLVFIPLYAEKYGLNHLIIF